MGHFYNQSVNDYYKILGVAQDADLIEIKYAFRKLAHQYHPDVSSDRLGEEKFKLVTEAYTTLKNPEMRSSYDRKAYACQTYQMNYWYPPTPIDYYAALNNLWRGYMGGWMCVWIT